MDTTPRPSSNLNPAFLDAIASGGLQDLGRQRKRKAKGPKQQKTVEALYADLIREGKVRIERRRGKPPLIVWL